MKTIFIIHSSIDIPAGAPTYEFVTNDHRIYRLDRNFFTSDERLRQTVYTVMCVKNCNNTAPIKIIDSSVDAFRYNDIFKPFKTVEVVPVESISKEAFDLCNNQKNPSAGVAATLSSYFQQNIEILREYDFIVMITGRYGMIMDQSLFTSENRDKIFIKKIDKTSMLYEKPLDNTISYLYSGTGIEPRQYNSQLYAFGRDHLINFTEIFNKMLYDFTDNIKWRRTCFFEDLLYYYTRPYSDKIIETEWFTYGWSGKKGHPIYG